jgi:type IV secretion system protein VirD4
MRGYRYLTACGSARWASEEDARKAGMLGDTGLPLGRMPGSRPTLPAGIAALFNRQIGAFAACTLFLASLNRKLPEGEFVRLAQAVHVAVFAPTGVGKGVSCFTPFLLTCPDSCVVVDFKGENARLTAEHRRKAFGQKIVLLDLFKVVTPTPDTLNPLDFIDQDSPTAIDNCRDLAEMLVIKTGQEKEPHWNESAETVIAASLALVVCYGEDSTRSLQKACDLLSNPQALNKATELMCSSDVMGGMLARLGGQVLHFAGTERASVLTTTARHLKFLNTLAIADSTRTSSFDPAELRGGKMTVYLILPPEHMRAQSALLRMWVGTLLREVVKGGLQESNKVHFILDEAASLGKMESIDDAVDKYRGYGIRLIFLYQSLGQLKKCFPEGQDQTLLSNTAQVFFGVTDLAPAEYVSNRCGDATSIVESGGSSSSRSYQSAEHGGSGSTSLSRNRNSNWQQQGRKLLKPEEVMALSPRIAITFSPGIPPLWTTLLRYYEGMPGGRFWAKVKTAAASVAVLGLTILLALGLIAMESNSRRALGVPARQGIVKGR